MKRALIFILLLLTPMVAFGAFDDFYVKGTNARDDTQIITVMFRDSTTGQGKTGLTYSGVTCYWEQNGDATPTQLALCAGTVGTYVNSGAAGTGGGFILINDTTMRGCYQLSLSDAMLASSATKNAVMITLVATGAIDVKVRLLLVNVNFRDVVRMGLTALPNAAADGVGGLPISDAGGLDLDTRLDTNIGSRMATFTYTPERGTDSALLAANYTPERGTDSALLASNYVAERGTDSALLAANYTAERGTNDAALASTALSNATWTNTLAGYLDTNIGSRMATFTYTPERGTDSALLATNYTPERGTDSAATAVNLALVAAITDHLATAMELDDAKYRFTAAALALAPGGGGLTAIEEALAAIQGATFETGTDSLEAIRDQVDAVCGGAGEGKVAVDHNTIGRVTTADGVGVSGATIRAYLETDYDAGIYTLRAATTTTDTGQCLAPLYLDDNVAYVLIIGKLGVYGPVKLEITP